MGTKYKNLFNQVCDIENLRSAYKKACNGKNRYTEGHLKFKERLESHLYHLQRHIQNGTYEHGEHNHFYVYEPKKRMISALPFRDRVVQHAINNIIEPIFDGVFYSCTYACRKNKGTHAGVKAVQSTIRQMQKEGEVYYLKMDFSKYFASIDRSILFKEVDRKISDQHLIALLETFGSRDGVGLPIGNLLSQLFANVYGHIFDRHIKEELRVKHYFRYMDDTVILSHDKDYLKEIQHYLESYAATHMKLKLSHWMIAKVATKPINFLGYRITAGYKLIRKDSVVRAKRKIKLYTKHGELEKLALFMASWRGHIRSADSKNLQTNIERMIDGYKCA